MEIEDQLAEAAQQATVSPVFSALDPGRAFLDAPLDIQRGVVRSVLRVEVVPHTGRAARRGPRNVCASRP